MQGEFLALIPGQRPSQPRGQARVDLRNGGIDQRLLDTLNWAGRPPHRRHHGAARRPLSGHQSRGGPRDRHRRRRRRDLPGGAFRGVRRAGARARGRCPPRLAQRVDLLLGSGRPAQPAWLRASRSLRSHPLGYGRMTPATAWVRCICGGCGWVNGGGRSALERRFPAWLATEWSCRFRSRVFVVCTWRALPALPAEPASGCTESDATAQLDLRFSEAQGYVRPTNTPVRTLGAHGSWEGAVGRNAATPRPAQERKREEERPRQQYANPIHEALQCRLGRATTPPPSSPSSGRRVTAPSCACSSIGPRCPQPDARLARLHESHGVGGAGVVDEEADEREDDVEELDDEVEEVDEDLDDEAAQYLYDPKRNPHTLGQYLPPGLVAADDKSHAKQAADAKLKAAAKAKAKHKAEAKAAEAAARPRRTRSSRPTEGGSQGGGGQPRKKRRPRPRRRRAQGQLEAEAKEKAGRSQGARRRPG